MTSHDESHITRTSPARMAKGLIIVFALVIGMGYFTITMWHFTASFPPPVSAPPPTPAATQGAGAGGSEGGSTAAAKPGTLTIPAGASTQGNPSYLPATLTVKKGDVVTVTNTDNVPHTATNGATPDDPQVGKLFDTSLILAGKSAQIKTASLAPGDYKFHCTVHPYMVGTLTVKG
jgi:plastocyanin